MKIMLSLLSSSSPSSYPAPALHAKNERALATARRALGEEAFSTAWADGEEFSLQGAAAEAQSVTAEFGRPPSHAAPESRPSGAIGELSRRELEVLALVARGLTSAQVAERLFLSSRTVGAHLSSIYHKLGVRSRSVATRLAIKHGLI